MNSRLLMATVGGSPEPLVASLLHWRPARVVFIVTPQTRDSVPGAIVPNVQANGWHDFDAGRYDFDEVPDAQDYIGLVNHLRSLDDRVASWRRDHPDAEVIADFTGGTKAMSAALALVAARWPCRFSYVGGRERTKDGVGIVVSGTERVVHSQNPADALGLLALETALGLLRTHAFAAAAEVLETALKRSTDPARKAELSAVGLVARALADWDRFQHERALNTLRGLGKHAHNLEAALGHATARALMAACSRLEDHLAAVLENKSPGGAPAVSKALVLDLLANARRRMDEQRWDDATARLYRALEATAQWRLARHGIDDTGRVPLDRVPQDLRGEWQSRAEEGLLKLGLQDAWRLLRSLDLQAAAPFFDSGLADRVKSPLLARNQSILAHGFAPVSDKVAKDLMRIALKLIPAEPSDLPESPAGCLDRQSG